MVDHHQPHRADRRVLRLPDYLQLRRRSPLSGWAQFFIRIAMLLGLLVFIIAVHWFERESLRDNLDGHVSFVDVLYFTMISATTTGYGDIVPVSDLARLFDALVVTPVRIFFLLIKAGTAYTFVIKRLWNRWLMQRLQKGLTDHIVVTGFGNTGSEAVRELIARGTRPADIVVVDCDPEALVHAEALGCTILQGTRPATRCWRRSGSPAPATSWSPLAATTPPSWSASPRATLPRICRSASACAPRTTSCRPAPPAPVR